MSDLDVSGYVSNLLGNFAGETIKDRFDDARNNAESAYSRALAYITDMQLVGNATYTPNVQQPDDVTEPDMSTQDITKPTAPDVTMTDITPPASITLSTITVDRVSGYPTMTVDELLNDLIVPTNTFDYSEENYTTDLLEAAKEKLQSDIEDGGVGFSEDYEDALVNRTLARDLQTLEDTKDRIASQWAETGWSLPDGVLATLIQEQDTLFADKQDTLSKEVLMKQEELAQQNMQFAVTQAVTLEGHLLNFENARRDRTLKAANDRIDNSIKIWNAAVQNITVRLDMYTRLLEAIKIEADINTKTAEIESEIQKNRAVVYSSEVDAFKSRVEAEKVRVETLNNAYLAAVEAYKATVQADSTRVESAVKAFSARVQKMTSLAEIYVKTAEIELSAHTENQKLKASLVDAAAKVAAQLAASAYASTQASIGLSESDTKHANVGVSKNSSDSSSVSSSTVQSQSSSTSSSSSVSTNHNYNYSE